MDANIWFSYFISKQENHLAAIILENELILFYCVEMLEEIKRVAAYKRIQKYNIATSTIISFIKMTAIHFTLHYPIKNYIPDDENDNYIVALAYKPIADSLPAATAIFYPKNKTWKKSILN